MCFTGEMSGGFAALGLFSAWWVWTKTNNKELASGVFFFFTMEFLQFIQYMFLATGLDDAMCTDPNHAHYWINHILTLLGFAHICLQPYFCHVINASLTRSPKYLEKYDVIKRLCLIGGGLLFARYFMSYVPEWNTMNLNKDMGGQDSTEWLRGERVCTFKTKAMVHLGWSIPMADPSYFIQGAGIHSFLMFAPFFALYDKKGMVVQGLVLLLTGPVLSSLITPNLMEQASVWCFMSIAQISIMLFVIRETLITNWGADKKSGDRSLFNGSDKKENKSK